MADAQDLISSADCSAYLAAAGHTLTSAQTTLLPTLVTEASQEICRFCRRYFVVTAYDAVLRPYRGQPDKGEPDWLSLPHYPVQSVSRIAAGRTTALTVTNTDPVTNQRAVAAFAVTGDPEITLTRTGLTLTRWASGTATASALTWTTSSPYTTVTSLAASVNALGNGWRAVVGPNLGGWAAADLWGTLAPSNALAAQSPSGASFDLFAADLADDGTDYATGTVYLPTSVAAGGPVGSGNWQAWPTSSDATPGANGLSAPVRVSWTAGFTTVPLPVQRACAELVKAVLDRLATDNTVQSETAHNYSYTLKAAWLALPDHVRGTLLKYQVLA